MSSGNIGLSGRSFDAFVSSQRSYNEHDLAAKIQEKYWRARQKFLAKVEKKEDTCIVLSDAKLDAKLEIYRSIDRSCSKLTTILEDYQNCLYVYANEENSLGILLKECGKHDKTKAGKIEAIVGKSMAQSSHQRIRLYMPLLRMYQEMETFHSRAVDDTASTVEKLEDKRSQYRASLLWMKDVSERLDPDTYRQLDKFRRVQNQVRGAKKSFDCMQMDVVQKIDLLMASRCNLINQILAAYQATLLETFERNYNNFKSIEEMIRNEDIYEYEFKTLKQLNPLRLDEPDQKPKEDLKKAEQDLILDFDKDNNNNEDQEPNKILNDLIEDGTSKGVDALIDISLSDPVDELVSHSKEAEETTNKDIDLFGSDDEIDQLENLFGKGAATTEEQPKSDNSNKKQDTDTKSVQKPIFNLDLLNMDTDEQIANLLGPSENVTNLVASSTKDGNDLFSGWLDQQGNKNTTSSTIATSSQSTSKQENEFDLMGDLQPKASIPTAKNEVLSSASIDLLTNELDDIDNSSYFKSLQRLQL